MNKIAIGKIGKTGSKIHVIQLDGNFPRVFCRQNDSSRKIYVSVDIDFKQVDCKDCRALMSIYYPQLGFDK